MVGNSLWQAIQASEAEKIGFGGCVTTVPGAVVIGGVVLPGGVATRATGGIPGTVDGAGVIGASVGET
jgi:hypothetical protein